MENKCQCSVCEKGALVPKENTRKYPWEIEHGLIESVLSALETMPKAKRQAVQLKYVNPIMIDTLTRKLFNQDRTQKGRVFAYAVVGQEYDENGNIDAQRESILALLPISLEAQGDALLFAAANHLTSILLHAYLEARREIDKRDQFSAESAKELTKKLE